MKIMQDGIELLSGDKTSIEVIFNNLTGINFTGKDYEEYLDFMRWKLDFDIIPSRLTKEVL